VRHITRRSSVFRERTQSLNDQLRSREDEWLLRGLSELEEEILWHESETQRKKDAER
jgi:hypothetical protein